MSKRRQSRNETTIVTPEQRQVLLRACEELVGSELARLKRRLQMPSERAGAETELVALFAGLTVGDARHEDSDSLDLTWNLVSGTDVCVEATHVTSASPRPIPHLEFRREIEVQLERRGIQRPWNIRLQIMGPRGAAKLGARSGWSSLFGMDSFRDFAIALRSSPEQMARWVASKGIVVIADGPEWHETDSPVELPHRVDSHPLYRATKKKASQIARSGSHDCPCLIVLSATDAVDVFAQFTMFKGDMAGPIRWAFGARGAGDFAVRQGALRQDGKIQNSRLISAVQILAPWRPGVVDFAHEPSRLVVNRNAISALGLSDQQLIKSAAFVTWRNGQLPPAEELVEIVRRRRDALAFNVLPAEVRSQAVAAVLFGERHELDEAVNRAIRSAEQLRALGASFILPQCQARFRRR